MVFDQCGSRVRVRAVSFITARCYAERSYVPW